jgi:hypothetical protein
VDRGTFFEASRVRGAPMRKKIRAWLGRAESCRRHFVSVEEVSPDPVRGADNRHGILGLVGRGRSDPADGVKTYTDRDFVG